MDRSKTSVVGIYFPYFASIGDDDLPLRGIAATAEAAHDRIERCRSSLYGREDRESKIEIRPLEVRFPGKYFLSVAITRPKGWEPRHLLDLPEELNDDHEHLNGYEWAVSCDTDTIWKGRDETFREAAEVNGGDSSELDKNHKPDDWRVVAEVGEPIGDMMVNIQIAGGIGRLAVEDLDFPIRIVRPTDEEISRYGSMPIVTV